MKTNIFLKLYKYLYIHIIIHKESELYKYVDTTLPFTHNYDIYKLILLNYKVIKHCYLK